MGNCIGEDDLLDLAHGQRDLCEAPALEGHQADCAACGALLAVPEGEPRQGPVRASLPV